MPAETCKYWAFISYSHADEAWARWLHNALERYRVPDRLVGRETPLGTVPRRLFPVFRDRDELPGSAELGPQLQRALEQSRFQIVICSPRSARSRWVGEEIKFFKSLDRAQRVLALIVDGEPHAGERGQPERECFPEALRFGVDASGALTRQRVEPIAADARGGGDGKLNAKLKLISGILGVGFDELKQRELHARNRRLAMLSGVASSVAAVTIVLAIQAYQARNDALRRQRQAEDLIEFMLGDLREKLEPIGKLAILDAVGNKAMDYFATLDGADQTDAALASRAKALRQIGEVRLKQGDMPGASRAFEEALTLDTELVTRHPDDAQLLFSVGESQFSVGNAHYVKGEFEAAMPWFERHARTARLLTALEPDNPKWLQQVVEGNNNLGAIAFRRQEFDRSRKYFRTARDAQQRLVDRSPDDDDQHISLARLHGWLSAVANQQRLWQDAVDEAQREADILRMLVGRAPDNAQYQERLAAALHKVVYNEGRLRPLRPDAPMLQEVLRITAALSELDPDNTDYLRAHRVSLTYLEDAWLMAGNLELAAEADAQALDRARSLFRRSPGKAQYVDDLLHMLARAAKLAWLRRDVPRATGILDEALLLPLSDAQRQEIAANRWLDLQLLGWWIAGEAGRRDGFATGSAEWLDRLKKAGLQTQPEHLMRYEALKGNRAEARRWFRELSSAEREHPFLQQFCRTFEVCG